MRFANRHPNVYLEKFGLGQVTWVLRISKLPFKVIFSGTFNQLNGERLVWVGSTNSADGKAVIQGGERLKGSLLPDSRPIPSYWPTAGLV